MDRKRSSRRPTSQTICNRRIHSRDQRETSQEVYHQITQVMYIINTDDMNTRCLLVTGCRELETVIRFMTRKGIWLNSLYWVDNLKWYQVYYEWYEAVDIQMVRGSTLREFEDICRADGGRILNIVPLYAHAR